ncbi:hypothetical protein GGS24DRAFT_514954 [Hypoxylon argillaceum]|nr:hypothetical protein GGS24DRAFT_514954 [Hypoxylon argillaceum]
MSKGELMLDENVSHMLATPTEYSMWFQEGAANLSRCSSWKWALAGGGALPKMTVRDFKNLALPFLQLYDFYGLVEATIAIIKDDLTAEKFIKNPFADAQLQKAKWDHLYETGDQGYLSEDGAFYYEGRIDGDTQIKLRGIRIELGEIETAIIEMASGAISQAVVAVHGEAESKFPSRLCALFGAERPR